MRRLVVVVVLLVAGGCATPVPAPPTPGLSRSVPAPPIVDCDELGVVTLALTDGDAEPSLVEVVRFEASDDWSVRRIEIIPSD